MNREYVDWENDKEVDKSIRSVLQTNLPQLLYSRLRYRLVEGEWIQSVRLWTFGFCRFKRQGIKKKHALCSIT